jgi:hypothetical protein
MKCALALVARAALFILLRQLDPEQRKAVLDTLSLARLLRRMLTRWQR